MEFNVIDENNNFKIGNIITVFKLPNYNEEFALFSLCDYEGDEASYHVAYLFKDSEGYDYIDEIKDPKIFDEAMKASKELIEAIN